MNKKIHFVLFVALLLILVPSISAQTFPGRENLTHLWNFEDGTANDLVGTAHGDYHGDYIFIDAGDLVTVPNGDGIADSWLDLPGDIIALNTYKAVSVAAWFTPDTLNTSYTSLWYFGNDGNGTGVGSDGFCLQPARGEHKARTWISCGNQTAPYGIENGVDDTTDNPKGHSKTYTEYVDLKLHHVVCEIDTGGYQGLIKMYHNGVYLGKDTLRYQKGIRDNRIDSIKTKLARFAHSGYSGDRPWLGRIHEIAIFNKGLTDQEVLYLYSVGVNGFTTSVENKNTQHPEAFSLSQNYPNPFNPQTTIEFNLAKSGHTSLIVYDVLGRSVALVIDGMRGAGMHRVEFNASHIPSGIYFYTLRSGNYVETKKMLLVK
jgi:hypothetical protein